MKHCACVNVVSCHQHWLHIVFFYHSILKVLCRGLCLEDSFNFSLIAEQTPGFVGADLMALVTEAALLAVNRYESVEHFGAICGT